MFSAFFGNYLLNKGLISQEHLTELLNNQKAKRLKLGLLAINAHYMTAEQVEYVHQLQAQRDRKFGQIAIIELFLTPTQLERLLKQQKSEHLILSQALLDAGYMDLAMFEKELDNYKKEYEITDQQFESLKNGEIEHVIGAFLNFEDTAPKEIFEQYIILFYRNLIRFIDRIVHVGSAQRLNNKKYDFMVSQNILSGDSYITGIAGDAEVLKVLAGIYAEETFEKMDDYAIDACGEYLNLHNGLFLVNQSEVDKKYELTSQQHNANFTMEGEVEMYRVPMTTSFGTFDMIIGKL